MLIKGTILKKCTAAATGLVFWGLMQGAEAKEYITFDVAEVKVQATEHWSEAQLRKLVPELEREKIDLATLSQQIQLVNEGKAVKLNAELQPLADGKFKVVLTAEEQREESVIMNVNNTGNKYTGDWRVSVTYLDKNLTGNADSLGVAYVTSPGHWDDVQQAALLYRAILPRAGDSLYLSASWSNVDLGSIGNFGGVGVDATGRGATAGLHYQHNFKNTSQRKEFVDVGVDVKKYDNATNYDYLGVKLDDKIDYEVQTASATYVNIWRKEKQHFSWNFGFSTNINSDAAFRNNRANSTDHFWLWKAGVNYQMRTPKDWILGLRANAQYTRDNVVTTEQFGAGGISSVRGFKERAAYADSGVQGSLEVYTPAIAGHSRFVFFTDWAYLHNNNPLPGEIGSDFIGSYGLGYRFYDRAGGWNLSLDYAHPYSNVKGAKGNLRPWHMNVTKEF